MKKEYIHSIKIPKRERESQFTCTRLKNKNVLFRRPQDNVRGVRRPHDRVDFQHRVQRDVHALFFVRVFEREESANDEFVVVVVSQFVANYYFFDLLV